MIFNKLNNGSSAWRITAKLLVPAAGLLFVSILAARASAQTTPTLTVATSGTPSIYGQSVTLTATISSGPTGNIGFYLDGNLIGTSPITGGTTATLSTSTLPGGVDSITAEYGGDANYNAVTSAAILQTVSKATPTVTVATSGSPSVYGTAVTLTATVTSGATGSVTFYSNHVSLGMATLSGDTATLTTTALEGGSDSITALYSGDGNYNSATSVAIAQTVSKANSAVTVATSSTESVYGSSVTLTATVTSGATGSVGFYSNHTLVGMGTLSGNIATLTTSSIPGGVDSITAQYNGDGNYNASTSPAISMTVEKATPSIGLMTSGSPSQPGAAVTFTATMSVGPTGSVTFYIDGKASSPSPLQGNIATLTTSALLTGNHRVTGVYSADGNYASVTSAVLLQTVGQPVVSTSPGEWTWLNGSETGGHVGDYGTLGTPAFGASPGARYYSSTWTDTSGNLWLFGGIGVDSIGTQGKLNDLWQFDPSFNEWDWMSGSNLVGAAGQPGVYGTLGAAAASNVPGGRQEAMSWTDSSNNLWLFGGRGNDEAGNDGLLNDLWSYNVSSGDWTWVSGSATIPVCGGANCGESGVYGAVDTAAPANVPGGRLYGSTWIGASGDLWLFGGSGIDANGKFGQANDLWKFKPSSGEWTWIGGSSSFGTGSVAGVYGTQGTAAAGNWPGSRYGASSWTDVSGNFWLFGGDGVDANGASGLLNDVWEFTPSNGEWTWVAGSSTVGTGGQAGVYGTLGSFASANTPGGRYGAASWLDSQGNLWLLGGNGFDSAHNSGDLNDLWKFDPTTHQWAWMTGSNVLGTSPAGPAPVYGTLGAAAPANTPGGRQYGASWTDPIGDFWLFGGEGADLNATLGPLNDVWQFQPYPIPATPVFSVAGGTYSNVQTVTVTDATAGATIYYTTNGTLPTRSSAVYNGPVTVSVNEELEAIAGLSGYSNSPAATATYTFVTATPAFSPAGGTYTSTQTVSLSDTTTGAVIYYTLDGSAPTTGSAQYSGALSVAQTTTINSIAVAPGFSASAVATATYTITVPSATPTISPAAGTYTSAQSVSIADATAGSTIYYTTDGTTPTTSSTQYTGALTVSASETIEAIAVAPGLGPSSVATAVYVINLPVPGFVLSASPVVLSVTAGQSVTTQVTVTPTNGFASAVSFTCSGLPSGDTCAFSPTTVTPGTGPVSTVLTVATASTSAALHRDSLPFLPVTALAAAFGWFGFRKRRSLPILLLLAGITLCLGALSGCGGSSVHTTPAPVVTTVTVTATSGSLQQTTQFSLSVN